MVFAISLADRQFQYLCCSLGCSISFDWSLLTSCLGGRSLAVSILAFLLWERGLGTLLLNRLLLFVSIQHPFSPSCLVLESSFSVVYLLLRISLLYLSRAGRGPCESYASFKDIKPIHLFLVTPHPVFQRQSSSLLLGFQHAKACFWDCPPLPATTVCCCWPYIHRLDCSFNFVAIISFSGFCALTGLSLFKLPLLRI